MYTSITTLVSLSLLSLSSALEITSPTADTILTPYNFTITWIRNSTIDPAHINIVLVNNEYPNHSLGTNVSVIDSSYTVLPANFVQTSLGNGTGWQININSVPAEGSAFVTQSEEFAIHDVGTGAAGASASSAAAVSSSASSAGSSSASASSASLSSGAASASSAAAGAATSSASAASSAASSGAAAATSASSAAAGSASATASSAGLAAAATGNVNLAGGLFGVAALALLV